MHHFPPPVPVRIRVGSSNSSSAARTTTGIRRRRRTAAATVEEIDAARRKITGSLYIRQPLHRLLPRRFTFIPGELHHLQELLVVQTRFLNSREILHCVSHFRLSGVRL
ncbi:hypothetical protein BRADI_5g00274v3 [Brachypodium distachyon]|uniref:Uncharacterized protein n=1 Tax=Brachypodium distachyon TaxID=15368 RepID=A0A2K2CEL7_BRADI|nr:hypothetical protein BRADI_5g00274v3 [Brachypodium distachyon]